MQRKIIAIGGGRLIKAKKQPQTLKIDQEIVNLVRKKRPNLVFIPTASEDNLEYCEAIEKHFSGTLGCKVERLLLFKARPSKNKIAQMLNKADIIYVGGGNTLRMMKLWRRLGIDKLLDKARKRGAVLCGLSAGAICWFRYGNSDSKAYSNNGDKALIKVRGLDFANLVLCPHYDVEKHRQPGLKAMMQKSSGIAVALDNCAAIEIIDDKYRIITSTARKNGWRIYWKTGKFYKEALPKDGDFHSMESLLEI